MTVRSPLRRALLVWAVLLVPQLLGLAGEVQERTSLRGKRVPLGLLPVEIPENAIDPELEMSRLTGVPTALIGAFLLMGMVVCTVDATTRKDSGLTTAKLLRIAEIVKRRRVRRDYYDAMVEMTETDDDYDMVGEDEEEFSSLLTPEKPHKSGSSSRFMKAEEEGEENLDLDEDEVLPCEDEDEEEQEAEEEEKNLLKKPVESYPAVPAG